MLLTGRESESLGGQLALELKVTVRPPASAPYPLLQIGFCFFVSLFFSPLLATSPPYATGPALM